MQLVGLFLMAPAPRGRLWFTSLENFLHGARPPAYNHQLFDQVRTPLMDYQQMIATMTPETYHSLRRAVELGKWPDGKPLTREQRENAMQAVIAWGETHLDAAQRIGHIDKGHKEGDSCDDPTETPLNWK